MLRNLYILSEGGWAIKSAEIFADLFYTLSLAILFSFYLILFPSTYGIVSLELFLLFGAYYYYLSKNHLQMYSLSILSQMFLFMLIVPIPYLHPLLVIFVGFSACLFHFLFFKLYGIRLQLSIYLLFFFFLWDTFLVLINTPLRIVPPTSVTLPFTDAMDAKSLGPIFSFPWLVGNQFDPISFRSSFEYLSTFVLVAVSWAAFRRPVIFIFFIGWVLLYFLYGVVSTTLPFPWVISFASLAFVTHIAPGRNFYGSFYLTLLCFFLMLPIAFVFGKIGAPPYLLFLIFFPLEGIMIRVFLGK